MLTQEPVLDPKCTLNISSPLTPLHILDICPSGFSFMTIHESQDCRGRKRAFL